MNPDEQNNQSAPAAAPVEPSVSPAGPQPASYQPVSTQPTTAPKGKGKGLLIALLALLLIGGGSVAAYQVFMKDTDESPAANNTQTTEPTDSTETGASSTTFNDSARQAAVTALVADLELYYGKKGNYPSAAEVTSTSFASSSLPTFKKAQAASTETQAMTISATLSDSTFAYKTTPDGCNNSSKLCSAYEVSVKVSAKQKDGSYVYKKVSMN